MSDLHQIFADAQKFSAQFGGFLRAAEEMAKLGNIEDAITHAKSRLMQAEEANRDHETKVAAAELDAAGVRAKADNYVEARKGEAEQIAQDAKAEATRIKSEAEAEADKTKTAAIAKVSEHESAVTALQGTIADLKAEHAKQTQALADVQAQINARRAEHDRVVKMHAELVAKIVK